jgi:DNA-binding transcriptional ArsR family regulator
MEISDPKAIRALAHPLRLDLLKVLGAQGPATAAQCGRALGVSQASCSFHLRQLAKYGLVADAGPGPDRRERRWRLPDHGPTIQIANDTDAVVGDRLGRLTIEQEMRAILDYAERPDDASPEWRTVMAGMAALSAEDAAEIKEKWIALLAPYAAAGRAAGPVQQPGQRLVRCFMAMTPVTGHNSTGSKSTDRQDTR